MFRHPIFDLYTGAALALGGPLAFVLPQRIFLEMIAGSMTHHRKPVPAEQSPRTAV